MNAKIRAEIRRTLLTFAAYFAGAASNPHCSARAAAQAIGDGAQTVASHTNALSMNPFPARNIATVAATASRLAADIESATSDSAFLAMSNEFSRDRGLRRRNDDVAFVASLIVPGTGQYMLRQHRWLPYIALEGWAWLRYLDRRSNARSLSRQYRDFAWDVARRVSTGARRDTTFPYYEILIHYPSSGAYDMQPQLAGTQPELDLDTYNGQQWDLAQRLFIPAGSSGEPGSAGYDAALAYYEDRALPDAYAFAWNTGRLEQQIYTNVISESDGAYRDATRMLGVILANHLASAVDALISARLRAAGVNARMETGFAPEARGTGVPAMRFDAAVRVMGRKQR